MTKQSIANQLDWAKRTKENLNEISFTMDNFSQHYTDQVEMLSAGNYFAESLKEIRIMAEEFDDMAKDIKRHIEENHIAYIDKQSKGLLEQQSLHTSS